MPEAVIVDAVRTPIGRAFKGSLKDVRADDLAAVPLQALVERNPGVDFAQTDDVMMGAASSFAEQGYNVGRNATLLAGFDHHVPGVHGQPLLRLVAADDPHGLPRDHGGRGRPVRRRGVESVSRTGLGAGMADEFKNDKLDGSDGSLYDVYIPMGLTAENVAERCHVTREQQDEWAVVVAEPRGRRASRAATSTARSSPSRSTDGTAGQPRRRPAAGDDDGGAGRAQAGLQARRHRHRRQLVPAQRRRGRRARHERRARRRARPEPRARIVASSVAAIRPEIMGLGPIPAIRALLEQAGMTMADIDVVELNEAFAAQIVPCMDDLGIDAEKLNPFGGAIALGHPFGMTGARIMTTLLNDLETLDETYGIESMCVAGGMGQAMLVERLN